MKNAKSPGGIGGGGVRPVRERRIARTNQPHKIFKQKKGIAYLKGEARALFRDQTRERLERNLESLESYCKPGVILQEGWAAGSDELGYWPSRELLNEIKRDVLFLALLERVKPILPVWEAFKQVNKRMRKLRLKSRVNDLIRRACGMLPRGSLLWKTVVKAMSGNVQAQCSLGEMVTAPKKLFELLLDDHQMVIQGCMAKPLADWLIAVGHPNMFEFLAPAEEIAAGVKAEQKREKARERQRRFRLRPKIRKKIRRKSVTAT